jgi:GT2 family glycosyltransferase
MNPEVRGRISIVIVSYNTRDLLARCLGSLHEDPSDLVREIIVVDNASGDGSVEMIDTEFPEVTLVRNPTNLGYARAVNRGIKSASGDYFLVLNPDIEARAESIRSLLDFMEKTPDAGIVGGRLLNPDGTVQMSCRTFYTLPVVLLRRTFLGRIFPNSRLVRRHLMQDWDHASDREVDWVIGACMMVRREAYENVGGMDERFFLYFEDVDWCFRMKKHGWRVYYCHSGTMTHHHRRESARLLSGRQLLSHLLSSFRYYDKWGTPVYALKRERRVVSLTLRVLLDILLINIAFIMAYYLRVALSPFSDKPLFPLGFYRGFIIFVNVVCFTALAYMGLYRWQRHRRFARDLVRVSRALFLSCVVIMASTYLTRTIAYSRFIVLAFWPISTALVTGGRALQRLIHDRVRRGMFDLKRVVVVGGDATAVDLRERLVSAADGGYDFAGFVVPAGREPAGAVNPVIGTADRIGDIVVEHRVNEVLVSDKELSREDIGNIVIAARRWGAEVSVTSDVTDMLIRGSQLDDVAGTPVVVFPPASLTGVRLLTKHASDYFWTVLGLAALVVASPVVLIVRGAAGGDFSAFAGAFRGLGRVVAGRNSLVGPMAPVEGEHLKPGIMGIRPDTSDMPAGVGKDRVDMYYIQNWSLSMDLEIIVSSVLNLSRLFRSGADIGGSEREGAE